MRFFCGPRLLVIDEFAYARHNPDPEANTALFEVISRRYLKSSTIVTSHAGIKRPGASGWPTRCSQQVSWHRLRSTEESWSRSTGRPIGCEHTSNAPNNCAKRSTPARARRDRLRAQCGTAMSLAPTGPGIPQTGSAAWTAAKRPGANGTATTSSPPSR